MYSLKTKTRKFAHTHTAVNYLSIT